MKRLDILTIVAAAFSLSCCSGAEFEEDNEAAVDRIESREDDIHDIVHIDRFGIQTYRHTNIQTYRHTDIQK